MKNVLKILLVVIVSLSATLFVFEKIAEKNDYYNITDNIKYDTVLDLEGTNIVYYYQSTCHYCNSIKDQMKEFTDLVNDVDGVDVKLVDMLDDYNKAAWYDWEYHNNTYGEGTPPSDNPDYISDPSQMHEIDDIKVTGTPTMILVEDGEVIDYQVGVDVFDILEGVADEFNIDYTFDRSKYGK